MLKAFEIATGIQIPYKFVERRSGDLPEYFADPSKAKRVLNWEANLILIEDVKIAGDGKGQILKGFNKLKIH